MLTSQAQTHFGDRFGAFRAFALGLVLGLPTTEGSTSDSFTGKLMGNSLGLVELLLVLLGVMGWGAYELWTLRRTRKSRDAASSNDRNRKP